MPIACSPSRPNFILLTHLTHLTESLRDKYSTELRVLLLAAVSDDWAGRVKGWNAPRFDETGNFRCRSLCSSRVCKAPHLRQRSSDISGGLRDIPTSSKRSH